MSAKAQTGLLAAVALAGALGVPAAPAWGQQHDADELAKQLANPIADLSSIPFQFNWDNGVGADDAMRLVLNVQPVVPFRITENTNLIGRFILPFISQPSLGPGLEPAFGTSDIVLSMFFSPVRTKGGLTWGVGPVFSLPTTTDQRLGSGMWSFGPTAVLLKQTGPWTLGGLVNQLWSFAETSDLPRDDVNQTFIQPFVAYGAGRGLTITVSSEATANWEADEGDEWTVPLLVQVTKVTNIGPFPFSVGTGIGPYLESPSGGPEWRFRLLMVLILPNPRK